VANYIDVEKARGLPGLRLVVPPVPGPWAEGAKGLFHVKGIPVIRVRQTPGEPNPELSAWTGESNAPQAILDDEFARTSWTEMILLAERLAPDPPLLPSDSAQRALLFGLGHLLCGEEGFGWQRRLMMFHQVIPLPESVLPADHPGRLLVQSLADRYGYSAEIAEAAPRKAAEVLRVFASRLEAERARGNRYLLGASLTALDIYWATFAALVRPLPQELCEFPPAMRGQYELRDATVLEAAAPILLEHRDFVYEHHLELPVDL
jgi:glutathione S-transferase